MCVCVIHFRVVVPLVVIIPSQVRLAAGPSGGSKAMVLCALSTRQPHNPPTPSEILLLPQGNEKKWMLGLLNLPFSQSYHPSSPRLGFCTLEASNSSLMDPSTIFSHLGARTEAVTSPQLSRSGEPRTNSWTPEWTSCEEKKKIYFSFVFLSFFLSVCYQVHNNKKDETLINFSIIQYFLNIGTL